MTSRCCQPPQNIRVQLQILQEQREQNASNRSQVGNTVSLPVDVYLYIAGEKVAELTQDADGKFILENSVFLPNTEYKLEIVPHILSGLIGRGGFTAPIITGETVEESILNFSFEIISRIFADGEIGVVLKDSASGSTLSNYSVEIINSEGRSLETREVISSNDTFTLPAGQYQVNVTKAGYESSVPQLCQVVANASTACNISLLPIGHIAEGTLTAVLTWQVDPRDLDSHLIKYDASDNELYHIYYGHESDSTTGDNLDVDDTSSYGSETVTIQDVDATARYVYAIYHFSGSGSISTTSSAVVNVQTSSDLLTQRNKQRPESLKKNKPSQ